ncbi:N-acetylglucosaminyltransferase complex, subunit PIG-A/SPT14 [Mycena venus]|uniref:N-acetylglucosaminyltransferase complex, subunit PIG-A/SPT14 n=1 Tax=Mycena venus TaxID=2733690 RepID=A0A8H6YZX6_9AGAR|nr:N-acetylglucosaminyltransferase complex, subunit PIG-A/SPT14 [Mycena venus]
MAFFISAFFSLPHYPRFVLCIPSHPTPRISRHSYFLSTSYADDRVGELQRLCIQLGVPDAVFMGQLTGTRLSEAFASGDVVSSPSITETFGQVTLQGMAAGLPVMGLYVEGTADLVVHGITGLLLDPLAPSGTRPTHAASLTDDGLGLDSPCQQGPETGVPLYRTPSNDSAVSLSLDPSPPPSTSAQRRTAEVEEEEEEEDIPILDSAVCLSPTPFAIGARGGEGEMEALELPPAQLTLPSPLAPY